VSRVGRHILLQIAASMKLKVECGDVETAFLQGEKSEEARQIYVEPTKELRDRLGIGDNQVLQLLGAVYGLRTAPKAWYQKVRKDLEDLGWRCNKFDQCVFSLHDYSTGRLIGVLGVYGRETLKNPGFGGSSPKG